MTFSFPCHAREESTKCDFFFSTSPGRPPDMKLAISASFPPLLLSIKRELSLGSFFSFHPVFEPIFAKTGAIVALLDTTIR